MWITSEVIVKKVRIAKLACFRCSEQFQCCKSLIRKNRATLRGLCRFAAHQIDWEINAAVGVFQRRTSKNCRTYQTFLEKIVKKYGRKRFEPLDWVQDRGLFHSGLFIQSIASKSKVALVWRSPLACRCHSERMRDFVYLVAVGVLIFEVSFALIAVQLWWQDNVNTLKLEESWRRDFSRAPFYLRIEPRS